MKLPRTGKYVVGVSGGVDSMTLLHLLVEQRQGTGCRVLGADLVVGHFNHGIRGDASNDEELVRGIAAEYGLNFEVGYGKLGPGASEEKAREARYKFLFEVKEKYGAVAIVTAHHQDDLLETAIINVLRGTGWRGLVAMQSNKAVLRPLLGTSKQQLVEYASANGVRWREDDTNGSVDYLRNRIRQFVAENMSKAQSKQLLKHINNVMKLSSEINENIATALQFIEVDDKLPRHTYMGLPSAVAAEVLMGWLKEHDISDFDRPTIERLDVFLRTAKAGKKLDIGAHNVVEVDYRFGYIVHP